MTTKIDRSALLMYPAQAMFALVNDIESYRASWTGASGPR